MTDFVKSQAAMTSKERVQNMRRRKEDVTIRYKNGNENVTVVVDDSTSSSTSNSFSVSESLEEERVQGERKPPLEVRISPPLLPANVPAGAESPPVDVFRVYQQNLGVLTPMIAESLRDAEKSDGAEWVCAAFGEAVKNNVLTWQHIETILERWRREGRQLLTTDQRG